ncbi:MAG: hypothetical protein KA146_06355 [Leptospiraceae bacterium]|nr:hypothetical protein [Leptospiraceae bacterium]
MKINGTKEEQSESASKEFDNLIQEIFINKVESISEEKKKETKASIGEMREEITKFLDEDVMANIDSKLKKLKESMEAKYEEIMQKIETDLKKENNTSVAEIMQELENTKSFINTENEKRIQNLLTEIYNVKDKQSYALEEIKKDSENNNLILVNKNSEITESLLARLESMEIEMRKAKKLNLILSTVAIGILLLLSGLQIYFKL